MWTSITPDVETQPLHSPEATVTATQHSRRVLLGVVGVAIVFVVAALCIIPANETWSVSLLGTRVATPSLIQGPKANLVRQGTKAKPALRFPGARTGAVLHKEVQPRQFRTPEAGKFNADIKTLDLGVDVPGRAESQSTTMNLSEEASSFRAALYPLVWAAAIALGAVGLVRFARPHHQPRLSMLAIRAGMESEWESYLKGHADVAQEVQIAPDNTIFQHSVLQPLSENQQLSFFHRCLKPFNLVGQIVVLGIAVGVMAVYGSFVCGYVVNLFNPSIQPMAERIGGMCFATLAAMVCIQLRAVRQKIAVIELNNAMMEATSIDAISQERVDEIAANYQITFPGQFIPDLSAFYRKLLSDMITGGDLVGDEHERLQIFAQKLGLTHEMAAPIHIEMARQYTYIEAETPKTSNISHVRVPLFKLLFISSRTFPEDKWETLLPWKEKVFVAKYLVDAAIRMHAVKLYAGVAGKVDWNKATMVEGPFLEQMRALRAKQYDLGLKDSAAYDVVYDDIQSVLTSKIHDALDVLGMDVTKALMRLNEALTFNRLMNQFAVSANYDAFPRGVRAAVVDTSKLPDRQELFRQYCLDVMKDGVLTDASIRNITEVAKMMAISTAVSERILGEVKQKVYLRTLRQEDGLKNAPSKAQFLQETCENLQYAPADAAELHEMIFSAKLRAALEKKSLSEEDEENFKMLCKELCIAPAVAQKYRTQSCGAVFSSEADKILKDAEKAVINAGENLSQANQVWNIFQQGSILHACERLRIDRALALDFLRVIVRNRMLGFVRLAKRAEKKLDSARELKKLVLFNQLVVTPLVEALQPKEGEEAKEDAPQIALFPHQKFINLNMDLDLEGKKELYKAFLMYSNSKNLALKPMQSYYAEEGSEVANADPYPWLSQLGDCLGLQVMEVYSIHTELAETAYQNQAMELNKGVGAHPDIYEEKMKDLQTSLNLTDTQAQAIQSKLELNDMVASIKQMKGEASAAQISAFKEKGADVSHMVDLVTRREIYMQALSATLLSENAEWVESEMVDLSTALELTEENATALRKEVAASVRKTAMVTAVAAIRQSKADHALKYLQHVIVCSEALAAVDGDATVEWKIEREVQNLFKLYCTKHKEAEERDSLAKIFGFEPALQAKLTEETDTQGFVLTAQFKEDDLATF